MLSTTCAIFIELACTSGSGTPVIPLFSHSLPEGVPPLASVHQVDDSKQDIHGQPAGRSSTRRHTSGYAPAAVGEQSSLDPEPSGKPPPPCRPTEKTSSHRRETETTPATRNPVSDKTIKRPRWLISPLSNTSTFRAVCGKCVSSGAMGSPSVTFAGEATRQRVSYGGEQKQRPEVQSEQAKLCCANHHRVVRGLMVIGVIRHVPEAYTE